MQNQVGTIECAWCGNPAADVGRDKGGKLYVVCDCGQHFLRTHIGQRIIRKAMAADEPPAEPPPPAPRKPAAKPATKRAGPAAPPEPPAEPAPAPSSRSKPTNAPAPDDPEPQPRERGPSTLIG